jgi:transposase
MTAARLALSDGLTAHGATQVAMASTGEAWKPVFTLLGSDFHVGVGKASHLEAVPGRQTAGHEAEGLAALVPQGLWQARVVPPRGQRARRELTRHRRPFGRERASLGNRGRQVRESAHITRARVATDGRGGSGRALWEARMAGQASPTERAGPAKGRLRETRQPLATAWAGRVPAPQRVVLVALWGQSDALEETRARVNAPLEASCAPGDEAVGWRDPRPGGARDTAELIVAQSGTARRRLPTATHLAAWAGVAPGHHESAGTRRSGRTRPGHKARGVALKPAAHAAARPKHTSLAAQDHRLAGRRGKTQASVAVAHARVVIASHLLKRSEPYRGLGGTTSTTNALTPQQNGS